MNSKSLFWLLTTVLLTSPPFASAQLTKLTIGNNTLSTNGLPAWMAKEAGIFRTNSLDVQIVYFRGGTITAMALIARSGWLISSMDELFHTKSIEPGYSAG